MEKVVKMCELIWLEWLLQNQVLHLWRSKVLKLVLVDDVSFGVWLVFVIWKIAVGVMMLFADAFDVTLSDISISFFRLTNASQFKGIFIEDASLVLISVSKAGAKSLSEKTSGLNSTIPLNWSHSQHFLMLLLFHMQHLKVGIHYMILIDLIYDDNFVRYLVTGKLSASNKKRKI